MVEDFSPCGIVCDDCAWFKGERDTLCEGCSELKGEPFWGECETYSCTEERGVEHCGGCDDFPCVDFMERYDPHIGPKHSVQRAGILAYREKYGDEKAAELARRIAEG